MRNLHFVPKMGLFYKIASLVSLTLIIAIGVSTAVSIREQTETIRAGLIGKNRIISKHLASSVKSAFWSLNWLFVEKQMKEITTSEDVTFLELIKPNGEVYMASGNKEFEEGILTPELMNLEEQVLKDGLASKTGEPIKWIITPLKVGNDKWTLIMGLSLKQVEEAKNFIIKENIVLGSTIFILGVLVSFLFARGMTRPIRQLVEGTKEIGRGNLDYRIKTKGLDELGNLSNSFNKMAEDLKQTTTSRDLLAMEINERKRAEEALRESEERFRSIVENSHDGILIVNGAYRFTYVNEKLCRILAYPLEEIIGQDFRGFLDEESTQIVSDRYRQRQKGEDVPSRYEFNIIRKNGEKRRVEIASTVIKDSKGIPQTIAHILDITDRIRAAEEKKSLEVQLQRVQKMEAIGTLAGGVAHDLNNILSGIVSYPELLLMDLPEYSPLRNPILTIQRSGQKAAAIVQDMLTLARRGVEVSEVVNSNQIISEFLKSPEYEKLKSYHPEVQVETGLETDLLNIMGSPVHLTKTVMNLVSNAAEAMPEGGKIFISTENRYIDKPVKGYDSVKEGDYVTITVSDTGAGIPPEDIERIFEPFYTKKEMGRSGTGLGMTVVWGTVKDHKGYIDVQSTEGKGTAFTLYFPATRKKLAKDKPGISIDDYMGNGESILVVDDVEEQRRIASEMLNLLGYSVTSVSSGEEAVEYMKNNSADLLVLDMIMDPGIDGLETYKRILELHPKQKAIIASGFSETERVKEAQRLGAGQYIKKPYMLGKIAVVVRNELDK